MGIFSDTLDDFEECIKLICQNSSNKSVLAVILIDSLVDIYSHRHAKMALRTNDQFMQIYERISNLSRSDDIKQKLAELTYAHNKLTASMNNFDQRMKWLCEENIIPVEVSNSIRKLHEYRNQYLHRLKRKETDGIAYAKLYFHLLQLLFIAIPINHISSTDYDRNEIVKSLVTKFPHQFSTDMFRLELVTRLNNKYNISFVLNDFIDMLKDFLSTKYNEIVDAMHFIIENIKDETVAIEMLENECLSGKVSVTRAIKADEFTCTSSKLQVILSNIRKLSQSESEHLALQKFNEIYQRIDTVGDPIMKCASDLDEYIQLQIDILRGK